MSPLILTKGEKVPLTATSPNVQKFTVGLGWEPNVPNGVEFDCDVTAIICGSDGKCLGNDYLVWYNNLQDPNGFVKHSGDVRDGKVEGDDETIFLDFSKSPSEAESIVFIVSIHEAQERNQNFGQIRDCGIRLYNGDTNDKLMEFDLNEDYSGATTMEMGKLYKHQGEWKFQSIGVGIKGNLNDFLINY